jgi:cholera toxin transcriptional activator
MSQPRPFRRYRFGVFEADEALGELRRQGLRVKLNAQPFQVLCLLLERPGELLTREQISRELWPEGTFVDYEHGVNSAMNRIREALGDKAASPRYLETLARRGYRFVAPVERIGEPEPPRVVVEVTQEIVVEQVEVSAAPATAEPPASLFDRLLATPEDLPPTSHPVVRTLFILLQVMYVSFYIGALANLAEIEDLMSPLPHAEQIFLLMIVTAALMIPVRAFLVSAVVFRAPGAREKMLKMWWFVLPLDVLWSLAPFLLLHHMNYGLALSCTALLVYSPFAQRALVLMGAGGERQA